MKTSILLIYLILTPYLFCQIQNTWTKKESFSGDKRARSIAFSVGDYGYVGMGEDTAEMTHNDLWRYDPLLDSWTQMSSLPGSTRRNAVSTALNGKGYVGLGADSSVSSAGTILDDWWEYDPTGNSWTQKSNYPGGFNENNQTGTQGVYFGTAFSIDSVVYVSCGKMGPDFYGTDLWKYSPITDAWTRLADFPGGDRHQLSSFAIDGKGYVGMGIDHDLYRKDWWQYDPLTDSWTEVAELPGDERGAASTFTLGQRGFVVFGSNGSFKDELWEYDPYGNSWQIRANFPADGRKNGIAFSIGASGYAGMGKGASGKRKSFYQYSPLLPLQIEEINSEISIFPNPSSDFISIKHTDPHTQLSLHIFTLEGKVILFDSSLSSQDLIDIRSLPKGTYLLKILTDKKLTYTEKLIVL